MIVMREESLREHVKLELASACESRNPRNLRVDKLRLRSCQGSLVIILEPRTLFIP